MPTPAAPVEPTPAETPVFLDEKLRIAWTRYGKWVYAFCGLVAAGIIVKGGIDYLAVQKELGIERDYSACVTPESFKAFAAEHKGHPLAALVELGFADQAYAAGKFLEAADDYKTSVDELPAGAFRDRARLGFAMSQARAGKTADAEASLRQILGDEGQLKPVRCEAGYDLAVLAVSRGRTADVQKLAEQLMQIDPSSPFAERAFALRSELPAPAPSASAIAVPGAR